MLESRGSPPSPLALFVCHDLPAPASSPPTVAQQRNLKRKSSHLSSPPPERIQRQVQPEEEREHNSKRRQVAIPTKPITWYDRGRSPIKTPATAAIDSLKGNSRLLEQLEKELIFRQEDLEQRIKARRSQIDATNRRRADFSTEEMTPFPVPVLRRGPSRSRSVSPDKILGKLANGEPPIMYTTVSAAQMTLPPQVKSFVKYVTEAIGEGYLPKKYEVSITCPSCSVDIGFDKVHRRILKS